MRNTSLLLLVFLAGCARESSPPPVEGDSTAAPEPEVTTTVPLVTDETGPSVPFACAPDTLREGETLVLTMQTPHGRALAIDDPSGARFFLSRPDEVPWSTVQLPEQGFAEAERLDVPAAVRAIPYGARTRDPRPVFDEPGVYTVRLSEDLITEGRAIVEECAVVFAGR